MRHSSKRRHTLPILLVATMLATGCSETIRIVRHDKTVVTGRLDTEDARNIVVERARITADPDKPAPFKDRRGRLSHRERRPYVVVPQSDIAELETNNRGALIAGISGSAVAGIALSALIPSAIDLAACNGTSSGCLGEEIGVGISTAFLLAGAAVAIPSWIIYLDGQRHETRAKTTLAPCGPGGRPCTPGLDTDGDGVLNSLDRCPTLKGSPDHGGCQPGIDSDGDGLLDEYDRCPTIPQTKSGGAGCPPGLDSDGDGLLDMYDKCPGQSSKDTAIGCPMELDSDGDGLLDVDDRCVVHRPDAAGLMGCPSKVDSDGDGVLNAADRCPLVASGPKGVHGCPAMWDSDGDGVPDGTDLCEAEREDGSGKYPKDGCPDTRQAVENCRLVLDNAIVFASGSARLAKGAQQALLEVGRELRRLDALTQVLVEGHTDGNGSRDANAALSVGRAEAAAASLRALGLLKGVTIGAQGFGESRPVGSNKTQVGRATNRRVEFRVVGGACKAP